MKILLQDQRVEKFPELEALLLRYGAEDFTVPSPIEALRANIDVRNLLN